MKIFHIPTALTSTEGDEIAKQYRITTLKNEHTENLQAFFDVFSVFSDLPFGLNPDIKRDLSKKIERIKQNPKKPVADIRRLSQQMRQNQRQYRWARYWNDKLNQNKFWETLPDHLKNKRRRWLKIKPFSYYASADISYLAFHTLQTIEDYIFQAEIELKPLASKNNETIAAFSQFIRATKRHLQKQQKNMAKAMLARLQLVAKHFDLSSDNILTDFLNGLSLENDFSTQSNHIDSLQKPLSQNDFLRFHHYIDHYGDQPTKEAFEKLPWVQQKIYYKNKSTNWTCRPYSLKTRPSIPTRLRQPGWLFKGRNARYLAFRDAYHQISLYLQFQQAKMLCDQAPKNINQDNLAKLQRIHHSLATEQARLLAFQKPLNRFFHAKTTNLLRLQIGACKQQQQQILAFLQKIDTNKATESTQSKLMNNDFDATLLRLKQLGSNLSNQEQPEALLSTVYQHLRDLLDPNYSDPDYLDKLFRLKIVVLTLVEADWNKPIKRLCTAGIEIRNILNELPEAIIAIANGETDQMPQLGELLVDIIDGNLIPENDKQTLIHLIDILIADININYKPLHPTLITAITAITALKNIITDIGTQEDRDKITQYEIYLQQSNKIARSSTPNAVNNLYAFSYASQIVQETTGNEQDQQSLESPTTQQRPRG